VKKNHSGQETGGGECERQSSRSSDTGCYIDAGKVKSCRLRHAGSEDNHVW